MPRSCRLQLRLTRTHGSPGRQKERLEACVASSAAPIHASAQRAAILFWWPCVQPIRLGRDVRHDSCGRSARVRCSCRGRRLMYVLRLPGRHQMASTTSGWVSASRSTCSAGPAADGPTATRLADVRGFDGSRWRRPPRSWSSSRASGPRADRRPTSGAMTAATRRSKTSTSRPAPSGIAAVRYA